jgi:hypothetical protein
MSNTVLSPGAERVAISGALKLCQLINPKGKFTYLYDAKTGKKDNTKYNLPRHYGALWSILVVMERFPDKIPAHNIFKVMDAVQWVRKKYVRLQHSPPPAENLNIWEFVVWHGYIKLGANALALLAISQLIRQLLKWRDNKAIALDIVDHLELIKHAEQLAVGIHKMRLDNGKFVHKAVFDTMLPEEFESEYYVGEALFALGHWRTTCQMLNSASIIEATDFGSYQAYPIIIGLMKNLAAEKYGVAIQSHWMLYAISNEIRFGSFGEELKTYLDALVADILERPDYRRDKRSTPIACRSEGLLTALPIYDFDMEKREKILQTLDVNIMLQLQYAKKDGSIVRGNNSNEVRIDYIQHNITAFSGYVKLLS